MSLTATKVRKARRFGWTPMALKIVAGLIKRRGLTATREHLIENGVRFEMGKKARKITVSLPTLSKIAVKMDVFSPNLQGRPRLNVRD